MRPLHVRTKFCDGNDVEMTDATTANGGVEGSVPPSSAEEEDGYAVVSGAMENVCTLLDDGFDDVFDSYEDVMGCRWRGRLRYCVLIRPRIRDLFRTRPTRTLTSSPIQIWRTWFS